MNTCDGCKHYTPSDDEDPRFKFEGRCAFMDASAGGRVTSQDGVTPWDYEEYACGCHVGPKFGCIKFEAITTP